jgi:hypothetical protein
MNDPTDPLSPLARKLLKLDPAAYSKLIVAGGGGSPPARDILQGVRAEELVATPAPRMIDARAMLAGLWLYFDWLDESHTISQGIEAPTGSFWHAIMHRREGDFSNSKYWYARCATHPALAPLAARAGPFVNESPADKSLLRIVASGWNPNGFVDLVQAVHDSPHDPRHKLAIALQRIEWQTLFDHCTRAALGN